MNAHAARHCGRAIVCCLALGLNSFAWPRLAAAQSASDSVVAQGLFDDARELMSKGKYGEACPKLEESQRLDPGSGTLLNLAACYEREGRVASAWSKFLEAAAAAAAVGNADRERAARERAAALAPRIARITIRVEGDKPAGLKIRRDGAIVGRPQWGTAIPADPGAHTVSASAPGRKPWERTVTLEEASATTISIPDLERAPDPPTKREAAVVPPHETNPPAREPLAPVVANQAGTFGTQKTLALIAGGLGIVGVVVGTVFGLRSRAYRDYAQEWYCDGVYCSEANGVIIGQRALLAGNISTAAFAVGAVGLVAGAGLWFTAPGAPRVAINGGTLQVQAVW